MRILIPATGTDLDAAASTVFGRCAAFVVVDTETLDYEAYPNPGINAPGGAGVQAAQAAVDTGPDAVVAPRVGPNAFSVLQAAGLPIYALEGGSVRDVVAAFNNGQLTLLTTPGQDHVGLGRRRR